MTGAKGFVGRNLCAQLRNIRDGKARWYGGVTMEEVWEYDTDTEPGLLDEWCRDADFVFNLAGVNRPKDPAEFMSGNFGFASTLLETLRRHGNRCPVMVSSSTQAALDNPYGESKRAGEELMFGYGRETGARGLVYRFPNVFGKWCRPNYNSAVATFCHNIAHDLPITVNDPNVVLNLVYIDDVVDELVGALAGKEHRTGDFCMVPVFHTVVLGDIVNSLYSFREMRENLEVPDLGDAFTRKLYSTYLSYLPVEKLKYPLRMNEDARGSFTEVIRTPDRGQVSVNVSRPGITKGEHWHNTKNEKFVVVKGRGKIQMRKVGTEEVVEFEVCGDRMEVVEMVPGYTHNIINLSETEEMVTLMWANEAFDPGRPDTYFEKVEENKSN